MLGNLSTRPVRPTLLGHRRQAGRPERWRTAVAVAGVAVVVAADCGRRHRRLVPRMMVLRLPRGKHKPRPFICKSRISPSCLLPRGLAVASCVQEAVFMRFSLSVN